MTLAATLHKAITDAGVPIVGVSIGRTTDKATWTVHPVSLQADAQPIIDAFNPADPVHVSSELDQEIRSSLDAERLTSAVVWAILKQMFPADTDAQLKTKYGVARTRIIDSYKSRPWLP